MVTEFDSPLHYDFLYELHLKNDFHRDDDTTTIAAKTCPTFYFFFLQQTDPIPLYDANLILGFTFFEWGEDLPRKACLSPKS